MDQAARRPGRLATVAWWSATAPLIALGVCCALVQMGAGGALVLTVFAGGLTAFLAAQLSTKPPTGRPATSIASAGLLGGLWVLGLVGWVAALGAAGLGIWVLVAATGGLVLHARRRPRAGTEDRQRGTPTCGPALESLVAVPLPSPSSLPELSTAGVCWAWRISYLQVQRPGCPGYEVAFLTDLRRACLDELERRDPVAFSRWLPTARAAGDPARAFCRQAQDR